MTNITLKPNNKPIKEGFYLVERQSDRGKWRSIISARVIDNRNYGKDLYLFLGEVSCFPLKEMEEDCLWSDEIIVNTL